MNGLRVECPGLLVGKREMGEGDADLMAINRYALRPVSRENVAIFEVEVCHDQMDGHFSRFPREELEMIARLVSGRPFCEQHDMRTRMPLGKNFRGWLELEGGAAEGGRATVHSDVYVLRTAENAEAIMNIEGGVWNETSIGFSFRKPECGICGADLRECDHVPGHEYGGEVCFYWMRNVEEVIEVSLVPAGSQGTEVVGVRGTEFEVRSSEFGVHQGLEGMIVALKGREIADCGFRISDSELSDELTKLELRRRESALMGRRWPEWAVGR